MSEKSLQQFAGQYATQLNLLWHHCADPTRCQGPRGFPDLVALGPGGLLAAELKTPDGETSPGQDHWIWMAHETRALVIPVLRDRAAVESALQEIAVPRRP